MQRRTHTAARSIVLALLFSAAASAASPQSRPPDITGLNLDELMDIEVVSAASLYDQRLAEAPASVTVITAQQIRAYGYRTLTDALRSAAGLFVTYDRNYEYVGVRGFGPFGSYNSRILLLVDGHRMNENIYDSANVGTDFVIDVDLIDRIEIVRGPSASLYGTNAVFAVVNVVTRPAIDVTGVRLSASGASDATGASRLTVGRTFSSGELVFSASLFHSGGQNLYFPEFDQPSTNYGRALDSDADGARTAFLRLSAGRFTLEAAAATREKGIPTASFGTSFNDPRNRTIDERGYVDARYERGVRGTELMTRLFYDQAAYRGTYVYDDEDGGSESILDDSSHGRWVGGELRASRKLGARHKVTAGTVLRYNLRQDQRSLADGGPILDDRRTSGFWAAYAQDEFRIARALRLNVGLRHDRYDTFGGTTNPRAALIYTPDEATVVKLLYGRAFRAPNAYELYYQDGGLSQKPAMSLEPETIRTYEIALERRLNRYTQAGVSLYHYTIADLVGAVVDSADDLIVFRNQATVGARGFELTTRGQWPGGWAFAGSQAFQDGADTASRALLAGVARHLSRVNVTVPLGSPRASAGLELQRASRRRTPDGEALAPFTLTNVTIRHAWSRRVDMSASVYNMFDTRHSDPAGEEHRQQSIPQPGRAWRVKLGYSF
jgi:iron complex outermembrane receptor protein